MVPTQVAIMVLLEVLAEKKYIYIYIYYIQNVKSTLIELKEQTNVLCYIAIHHS